MSFLKKKLNLGKPVLSFPVSEPGYDSSFQCLIYQTREEANQAYFALIKYIWGTKDDDSRFAGCVQDMPSHDAEDPTKLRTILHCNSDFFATMFLSVEDLSAATISHECTHAAFSNDREVMRYTGPYTPDVNGVEKVNEERLVTKAEAYFQIVVQKCLDAGLQVRLLDK